MNQTAQILSIYAADTSGVCSALFELGGMTVIHDASGCNSTYTTHDEPRWYRGGSMMYISALTESDAVMGNDERFISDLTEAANRLKPEFIAICASPMPAMTGVDMEAIAFDVGNRTGIPAFSVKTNGMHSYIPGAANAFEEIVKRFCQRRDRVKGRVNIIGATPLDFSLNGSVESIKRWLTESGFEAGCCLSMGCTLDDVRTMSSAEVSLVISSTGVRAAEHLRQEYGIPYVKGVPLGRRFPAALAEALTKASAGGTVSPLSVRTEDNITAAVLGEGIFSASLAEALALDKGIGARVIETVGESDLSVLAPFDLSAPDEDACEQELKKHSLIIADPLFRPIAGSGRFVSLPHEAFSGRCFEKDIPDLIGREIKL